ncbi:MAG TPA: V-type ATP synthase subunit I, partial [Thermoanaerobacterales bacterium]|nr:V-type ATP synthase subunit I [Thermoanaerobacterales bacterium]
MAIVNMKKMHLLGLKSEQSYILSALQKTGVVEVIDITEAEQELDGEVQDDRIHHELTQELLDLENKLSNLKFGIDFLKPYVKSINPLIYGKPSINKDELSEVLSGEEKVLETLQAVFDLDKRISQLKAEESKLQSQIEMLLPWRSLDIPLEQLGFTDKTNFITAVMPRKARGEFEEKLDEEGLLAGIKTLGESQDDVYTLIFYHKGHSEDMQNLFKEISVNIQDFPGLKGTPDRIIKEDQKRLTDIEKERENIKDESKKLSDQRLYFEILYDYYSVERDRKSALLKVADTDKTFSIQAWLPEQYEGLVNNEVLKVTDTVYVEFGTPSEDEEMPVLLSNGKLVEPFEVITELYSLPDPRGIDPNLYMAPFYFVFFGMMLSDAGYGIIMSLLTGYVL